jgi:hypothetical protein
MTRIIAALLAAIYLSPFAIAQDKTPSSEKTRETAADAMKKSEVKDSRILETTNLVVACSLPEAKAKTLADNLQKMFMLATKALKFDEAELKGAKMIVYAFPDLDNFRQYQRSVLKQRPEDELAVYDVKRDDPFVAVSPRRGDRNPNFELLAGNELCRALLTKKGGNARITEWMKDGFARAVQMRLNPGSIGTDRAVVRRMAPRIPKTAKATPVVDTAWTGMGKEKDLVAANLMDFLTFGEGAEKFGNIMNGLIPADGGGDPTFADALKAADWMLEDLDRAWREWLAKGSPANK